MDELIAGRSAKEIEMDDKMKIDPETELFGHASTIEGLVDSGYALDVIDSRIAFPILLSLQKYDDAAKNALYYEIERRWSEGNDTSRKALLAKVLSEQPDGSTINPAFFVKFYGTITRTMQNHVSALDMPFDVYKALSEKYPELEVDTVSVRDIFGGNPDLRRGSSCPFCGTEIEWEIDEMFDDDVSDVAITRSIQAEREKVIYGYYIGNVDVDEIGENYYAISSYFDDDGDCPECGASRFSFGYTVDVKTAFKVDFKADLENTRFVNLPIETKTNLLSTIKALQSFRKHLLGLFSEYTMLTWWLDATGTTRDFINFLLEHELEKDVKKTKRACRSYRTWTSRDLPESGITITDKWNDGEDAGDGDEVVVSVKYEGIDTDEIVSAYIEARHVSESKAQALMSKRAAKPDVSKFKRLERFAKG